MREVGSQARVRAPVFSDVKRELRDSWTAKHRNVMTKLVVEGGWVQKRVYDIGWSDDMRRKRQRRRDRSTGCFFPEWKEARHQMLDGERKWEYNAQT